MQQSFTQFQNFFNNHDISISSKIHEQYLQNFTFFLITKDNFNKNEIDQRKNNSNIIVIDRIQKSQNDFLIICFDNTIIIISFSDFNLLQNFFNKNKKSKLIFVSNKVNQLFTNFSNKTIPEYLNNLNSSNHLKINQQEYTKNWSVMIKCLLVYFIEKKMVDLDYDRIKNFYLTKKEENEINKDDYITLKLISQRNNSTHELIYYIQKDEISVMKIFKGDDSKKLFNRECKNYINIRHPLIPQYYGYDKKEQSIIIEYINGQSLADIKKMKLDFNEKVKIILEIMILIEFLHNKHYIYRDIKSDNFIIDLKKSVVLIDFDRLINNDTRNQDEKTTVDFKTEYAAPEITKNYSYEVDIYSLGLIIYFIIFEKDPNFQNKNIFDHFPEKYSQLEEICKKCIEIDPRKRPKISELIDFFYANFFSKITNLNPVSEVSHDIKCFDYWVNIAEYNNYYALTNIAKMYEDGNLVKKDDKKANEFHLKATKAFIQKIDNIELQKMYSNFKYIFYYEIEDKQTIIKFLQSFNFITYYLMSNQRNAIICCEKTCLLFENVNINEITKIVNSIKVPAIIDVEKDDFANNEIENVCKYYQKDIDNNQFIQNTLKTIATYLIRRFLYPTSFFKDPLFFSFDPKYMDPFDRRKLFVIFYADRNYENIKDRLRALYVPILIKQSEILSENIKYRIQSFKNNEFITLKKLHSNNKASFELVFHINSNYIFMLKRIKNDNIQIDKEKFAKLSAHDSFIHFYGVLEENNQVKGFVYEYMSNGLFSTFVNDHKKEIRRIDSFITYIRLFHAYEHLQIFYPNHQNIEISNIFIDHDKIPYISYSFLSTESPKQTFSRSFGEIIYYIFEKKEFPRSMKESKNYPSISECSEIVQKSYHSYLTNDELTIENIESNVFSEFDFFNFSDYYIVNNKDKIIPNDILNFTYELLQLLINMKRVDLLASKILDFFVFPFLLILKMMGDMSEIYYQIGLNYEGAFQGRNQYDNAKKYYEMAIKTNHSKSLFHLGHLYENGNGVEQNYLKAKELYELAGEDNLYALLHLGMLYENGCGVIQNTVHAKEYFKKAIEKNNSNIALQIGDSFYEGKVVHQDYSKAIEYYKISAKQNNSKALFKLGNIYENGIIEFSIKKDLKKALEYYELAGKQNNSEALVKIGDFYYYGQNFEHDLTKARSYYEMASKLNNSRAFYQLALMYKDGYGVDVKDIDKSNSLFNQYAEMNAETLLNFGLFYANGYGVEKNYLKSKEFYELSIDCNGANALYYLGLLYKNGDGVKKDIAMAKNYFNKYAHKIHTNIKLIERDFKNPALHFSSPQEYFKLFSQKNSVILLNLGKIFEKGEGFEQNKLKAKHFYELSIGFDNSEAYYRLGKLYEKGNIDKKDHIKIDYKMAVSCYEKSIQQFNTKALYHLGLLYEKGLGVKQDYSQAKHYFELSANKNFLKAYFKIGELYLNGKGVDFNFGKSTANFNKCIDLFKELKSRYLDFKYNYYYYLSNNYLGLINLIHSSKIDLKKARNYIRESELGMYPYAQNNMALFYHFYDDKPVDEEQIYLDASKQNFAMADYNLGYFYEKDKKIEKAINFYVQASNNEDRPLVFKKKIIEDEYLEISKTFIICLTNLKLTKYYLSKSNTEKGELYFLRVFKKLITDKNRFIIELDYSDENDIFSNLKYFILNFPDFHLVVYNKIKQKQVPKYKNMLKPNAFLIVKPILKINDEKSLSLNSSVSLESKLNKKQKFDKFVYKDVQKKVITLSKEEPEDKSYKVETFNDPKFLFQFAVKNEKMKQMFINEIDKIINEMNLILYKPPYTILFGRMNSKIMPSSQSSTMPLLKKSNIDDSFYEAFDLNGKT